MAISTGIGSFKTGFLRYCVKGSNLVPGACKINLVGQSLKEVEYNKTIQIISEQQSDDLFGANSSLAEMVRKALCNCSSGLYVTPTDPTGLPKAVHTVTIAATDTAATGNGVLTVDILGQSVSVVILETMTPADIITELVAAINGVSTIQFTASASGSDLVLTADNCGEIGNQVGFIYVIDSVGITVSDAVLTTAGAGAPPVEDVITCWGSCCWDCIAYEGTDAPSIDALVEYAEGTWGCGVIQCFSQVYHGAVGTAADLVIDVDAKNDRAEVFIPIPEGYKYSSYQMAAAVAARSCCACCADPGRPIARDNGVLNCLTDSSDCINGSIWTDDEKEALAQAGALIWDVNANGNLWIELAQTTWKQDANGNNDITWTQIETRCVLNDFIDRRRAEVESRYSSVKLFKDGTKLPIGSKAITPQIYKNEYAAWLKAEVGLTIDDADFQDLIQVEIDCDDPNRINECASIPFVNQLLRIAGCVNVDISTNKAT